MSHSTTTPLRYVEPIMDFAWSPAEDYPGYTINGNTYPTVTLPAALVDTELTFTATVDLVDSSRYIVKYEWNFGDGTIGQGNPITHTYRAINATEPLSHAARVSLCVIDNTDQRTCIGKDVILLT